MKASQKCFDLIESEEGKVNRVYKDQAGFPSIGIGHKLTSLQIASGNLVINGEKVSYVNGLTDQQCHDLLAQDVVPAENEVNQAVKVTLNQNQFDALVDFTFNCGVAAFASSSALIAINSGQFDAVPIDFEKWNKITVNGEKVPCPDLTKRRAKEAALFMEVV
jgi:lysozyme